MRYYHKIIKIIISLIIVTFSFAPFLTVTPKATPDISKTIISAVMISLGYTPSQADSYTDVWKVQKPDIWEEIYSNLSNYVKFRWGKMQIDVNGEFLKIPVDLYKTLYYEIGKLFADIEPDEDYSFKKGVGLLKGTSLDIPIINVTYNLANSHTTLMSGSYHITLPRNTYHYSYLYPWIDLGYMNGFNIISGNITNSLSGSVVVERAFDHWTNNVSPLIWNNDATYTTNTNQFDTFGVNRWHALKVNGVFQPIQAYKILTVTPTIVLGLDPAVYSTKILTWTYWCASGCSSIHNDMLSRYYSETSSKTFIVPAKTSDLTSPHYPYIAMGTVWNDIQDALPDMWIRSDQFYNWDNINSIDDLDMSLDFYFDEDGNLILGGIGTLINENYYGVVPELIREPTNVEGANWDKYGNGTFDFGILTDIFKFFVAIYNLIADFIIFIVLTFTTMAAAIGSIITSIFSISNYFPTQIAPLLNVGITIFTSLIILGIIRFVIKLGGR
jgi:hypothetical protein